MIEIDGHAFEPERWLVLFHKSSAYHWLDRWLPGKYKHVSAIGFCAATGLWVSYDVGLSRTAIKVLPDGDDALSYIARQMAGKDVLRFEPQQEAIRPFRFGFWCVIAIKHLLGLRSGALRPSRLWRDLKAQGAIEIHYAVQSAGSGAAYDRTVGGGGCVAARGLSSAANGTLPTGERAPPIFDPAVNGRNVSAAGAIRT